MKPREQQPDPRPGNYYVSIINGGQYRLLAGPYHFHRDALDMVEPVKLLVRRLYSADPNEPWYSYGTARLPLDITRPGWQTPPGLLNDKLRSAQP